MVGSDRVCSSQWPTYAANNVRVDDVIPSFIVKQQIGTVIATFIYRPSGLSTTTLIYSIDELRV